MEVAKYLQSLILTELQHNKNKGINLHAGVFKNSIQFCYSFMLNFTPTQYKYITVKIYNNFILLSHHRIPAQKFCTKAEE